MERTLIVLAGLMVLGAIEVLAHDDAGGAANIGPKSLPFPLYPSGEALADAKCAHLSEKAQTTKDWVWTILTQWDELERKAKERRCRARMVRIWTVRQRIRAKIMEHRRLQQQ